MFTIAGMKELFMETMTLPTESDTAFVLTRAQR
jgi:hypothetical protein